MTSAQQRPHGWTGGWTWPSFFASRVAGCRLLRPKSCFGVRWIFLLVLLAGWRVGEASHPGPAASSDVWTLGVANPSCLNGKLDQVCHLDGHVWLLSETQLSQKGISTFTKGLKMLKSRWKYDTTFSKRYFHLYQGPEDVEKSLEICSCGLTLHCVQTQVHTQELCACQPSQPGHYLMTLRLRCMDLPGSRLLDLRLLTRGLRLACCMDFLAMLVTRMQGTRRMLFV
jgi:hypothetical protein